jgi:hypothetical protein
MVDFVLIPIMDTNVNAMVTLLVQTAKPTLMMSTHVSKTHVKMEIVFLKATATDVNVTPTIAEASAKY